MRYLSAWSPNKHTSWDNNQRAATYRSSLFLNDKHGHRALHRSDRPTRTNRMTTKNTIKTVQSLKQQKYRRQHGLFVVEGRKMVDELMRSSFDIEMLFATEKYLDMHDTNMACETVSATQMEQMSGQDTEPGILAVVRIPEDRPFVAQPTNTTLALDNIGNPGNMGTIIRTADWFGVKNIVCSENCVEAWNPKVVQATMGSLFRVNIYKTDLCAFMQQHSGIMSYGAFLEGENIFSDTLDYRGGIIVIGSESHGISEEVGRLIGTPINIPKPHASDTESLNASIATAIILSELYRKQNLRH